MGIFDKHDHLCNGLYIQNLEFFKKLKKLKRRALRRRLTDVLETERSVYISIVVVEPGIPFKVVEDIDAVSSIEHR